jgi:integrase
MSALTAKKIESLKPGPLRREIADSGCRGLYLVVQPSGRRSWAVRYRFAGKPRKLTLDGFVSLAEARRAATGALAELDRGNDPAGLKFDTKAAEEKAAAARAGDTVDNLVAQFIERHVRKNTRPNSARQAEGIFSRIVLPAWKGRLIHDVKRRDVIELLEAVAEDRPIMANRAHAILSKFFKWLAARDVIVASPVAGVARPAKETPRDRILSDVEIKAVWNRCDVLGGISGTLIKMLLITGQRRGEVAGMGWAEIEDDIWTLPPERTKNGQKHSVPLSMQAMAMIAALPRISDERVFAGVNGRQLAGFSHIKAHLDAALKLKTPWTLHDLRRTAASGMAKIGIKLPVIEKVLNHTGGSFAGIAGIYQRHDFAAEKREALQRWADHIDELLHGRAGAVVPIRAARS